MIRPELYVPSMHYHTIIRILTLLLPWAYGHLVELKTGDSQHLRTFSLSEIDSVRANGCRSCMARDPIYWTLRDQTLWLKCHQSRRRSQDPTPHSSTSNPRLYSGSPQRGLQDVLQGCRPVPIYQRHLDEHHHRRANATQSSRTSSRQCSWQPRNRTLP